MESMLFLEAARSGAHNPDFPGPVCVNPCGIGSVTQNWYSDDASEIPNPRMARGRRNIVRPRLFHEQSKYRISRFRLLGILRGISTIDDHWFPRLINLVRQTATLAELINVKSMNVKSVSTPKTLCLF
jgi:hypothetical protein